MAVSPGCERLNSSSGRQSTSTPSTTGSREPQLTVLYLDHCAQLSGGEIALARLVAALPATGVRCEVVLGEHGLLEEVLAGSACTVQVVPLSGRSRHLRRAAVKPGVALLKSLWDTAAYVARLASDLRHRPPDLVVTNSLKAALYGGMAGRLARIPVVWHLRDRIAPDYLPRSAVALVRLAARVLPQGVIANSHATLATLRLPEDGRRRPVTAVIGDPLATPVSSPALGEGPLVVGMVGRLAPWKGQDIFLRAFARAFPVGPERALVVGGALFGEDAYAASLPPLASSLGLEGRVEFTGQVVDVSSLYSRMDILVHASTVAEPFGQVIVEGMAEGVPVVAAAAGGPTEIVTDGVDGILYPTADVGALGDVLRQLGGDGERRRSLSRAGRETARRFAPAAIAAETQSVYRHVLELRPARRSRHRSSPAGRG